MHGETMKYICMCSVCCSRATFLTPNTYSKPPHPGPPTYYNIRTIHHIAVTTVLRSWRWANDCPKHVELIQRSIKLLPLHLVGHLYYSPTQLYVEHVYSCMSCSFRYNWADMTVCINCRKFILNVWQPVVVHAWIYAENIS
jgi:hypothetical protein